jgi:peroxiredoxin
MKTIAFTISLFCLSVFAHAQTDQTRYVLPDGKEVTKNQLDSVNKSWGAKGFMMKHQDKDPNTVFISPMTEELLQQYSAKEAELNKMLNVMAPGFSLYDINGKKWQLSALKGQTVVLNFWFTTCTPCIEEMPKLNMVRKKYAGRNVVFLGLGRDKAGEIRTFLKTHDFRYNLLASTVAVGKAYHIGSYPTSVVIDPQGVIRFQQVGGRDIETGLARAIENTINR